MCIRDRLDTGCLSHLLPLLDFALDMLAQLFWRGAFWQRAYLDDLLSDLLAFEHLLHSLGDLLDDRGRRASWQRQSVPTGNCVAGQTGLNKGPVSYTHLRAHETVLDL